MQSFIFYAWTSSILGAVVGVTAKLTSKYGIKNPFLFNYLWQFFVVLLTIPIALRNGASMPGHWANVILAAIFSSAFLVLVIKALYSIDVSVLSPLYSLQTVFSLLLGTLVLREVLSPRQIFLVSMIILGGVFVSYDEHLKFRAFLKKPVILAIFTMALLPLQSLFLNRALKLDDYWTVTLWLNIFTIFLLTFTLPKFRVDVPQVNRTQLIIVFFIALIQSIGSLAYNKAVSSNVSISNTINSLPISMIMVFILSTFYPSLLEKHKLKVYVVRFSCAIVMIISALNLSIK